MNFMSKKNRFLLVRIIIALACFIILLVADHMTGIFEGRAILKPLLFLIPFLTAGYDVLIRAGKNIVHGDVFDENFLMIVAGIGAYVTGEYSEAAAVMIFYQVGELFQSYAVGKSRESIAALMNICPEVANVETEAGIREEDPDDVEIGSIIIVRPGEKIPIDSVVIEGETYLDTTALTGEAVPRHAAVGDHVVSGCINGQGTLRCRTEKAFEDSTVAKVLELVENAGNRKSRAENFITKFAKFYTPVVTIGALLLALIPSLITGNWAEWVKRACTFLVISCPCALVISVPLGFFGGIGAASRRGILIKGSNFFEVLNNLDTVCFDKTGTLTRGVFEVTEIFTEEGASAGSEGAVINAYSGGPAFENSIVKSEQTLYILEIASLCESYSTHPIATSIRNAYEVCESKKPDLSRVTRVEELPGRGVSACIDGKAAYVGNVKLMTEQNIDVMAVDAPGKTLCHVAYDGHYLGAVAISDVIKEDAAAGLSDLKKSGVKHCIMLTGDLKEAAEAVRRDLEKGVTGNLIDEIRSELLPQDKVNTVEELLKSLEHGKSLGFVGDGINDAPVLMRADVGFAMGSLGSDSAIEAADVVIMDDDLRKIGIAGRIAGRTIRIVRQNIIFAIGVKLLVLILGALGLVGMWAAVFADVGVAVLAILNSMRTLKNTEL